MAFSMKVSNDAIEGFDVIPSGHYEVKLVGFAPKTSKKGDSFNLNPTMVIVNHTEFTGRKVFDSLNIGGAFMWVDFCHCFGLPMETDGKESWLPGKFYDGLVAPPPEEWKYVGPLVGRIGSPLGTIAPIFSDFRSEAGTRAPAASSMRGLRHA